GAKYVSERLGETGTDFYLPEYTLVRLLGSYQVLDKLALSAVVNNLFDERYYPASYSSVWVTAGAPRQYRLRATYEF
ncbi:TonB-dependent receptor, partial [Klebsiella pneumoniae]